MSQTHMQIVHAEAMRADRMQRAERYRTARARTTRPGIVRRLRAVNVAFRRPELVAAPTRRPAQADCGC